MSKTPLISVVLPIYNVELTIKESLMSIINQTFQDFEILIIDDCSTDNSINEIKKINDNRIRIITKNENKGLIDSLNIGFEQSKGEFIARTDGDDINVINRFEKQLNFLKKNIDIDACGCWLQCFGANVKTIKHKELHQEIQANLLLSNPMSLGAVMLRNNKYKKYKFDSNMIHVEDYDFWARTSWDCKLYNLQEVLYHYRIHNNQISTNYKNIQLKGDVVIKLNLFKKLNYNESLFPDSLIIKFLYRNDLFTIKEFKLILLWFKDLKQNNIKFKIFDNKYFLVVMNKINKNLFYKIFMTNEIKGIDYQLRIEFFKQLPFQYKLFVFSLKMKEKFKFLIKK